MKCQYQLIKKWDFNEILVYFSIKIKQAILNYLNRLKEIIKVDLNYKDMIINQQIMVLKTCLKMQKDK